MTSTDSHKINKYGDFQTEQQKMHSIQNLLKYISELVRFVKKITNVAIPMTSVLQNIFRKIWLQNLVDT
jgi:hypothetical protein